MGLIVPQLSAGVINRQTWRPGALSALAAQKDESLLAARTALQAAWDSFGQARVVHDEWERYYIENMDFAAADRLAEETCESLIGGKRSLTGKGRVRGALLRRRHRVRLRRPQSEASRRSWSAAIFSRAVPARENQPF